MFKRIRRPTAAFDLLLRKSLELELPYSYNSDTVVGHESKRHYFVRVATAPRVTVL